MCRGGEKIQTLDQKGSMREEDKDAGGPDLTECQRPGPASVFLRSHSWPSELYMATDLGAHLSISELSGKVTFHLPST